MPLLALWKSNPTEIHQFSIEQVVGTAGDGNLKDGSECSVELRAFLSQVPSAKLGSYVQRCLSTPIKAPLADLRSLRENRSPRPTQEIGEKSSGLGQALTIDALKLVGELTDKLVEFLSFLREAAHKQCGTCCREAPRTSVLVK